MKKVTYPLESETSLEIFIFLVVPLYKSSRVQGNVLSIGGAFLGTFAEGSPAPLNCANMSSPNMLLWNADPPALDPPARAMSGMPCPKPENPKNSEKISSGFLVLNRNMVGPPSCPPGWKPVSGGGTPPFKPSSPYWSYTARFWGSLKT